MSAHCRWCGVPLNAHQARATARGGAAAIGCRVEGWPLVSAHTPGEWVVDDDRKGRTLMVLARDGGMAIIVNEVGRPATKTDRANACLIAQAPPLLRELRIAVQFCGCTVAERESGHRIDCWAPSALDVIEKAEGRQ